MSPRATTRLDSLLASSASAWRAARSSGHVLYIEESPALAVRVQNSLPTFENTEIWMPASVCTHCRILGDNVELSLAKSRLSLASTSEEDAKLCIAGDDPCSLCRKFLAQSEASGYRRRQKETRSQAQATTRTDGAPASDAPKTNRRIAQSSRHQLSSMKWI